MKRLKILAMGIIILAVLFGNTAVWAAGVVKKQVVSPASPVKAAAGAMVITASKIEVTSLTAPVGKNIFLEARLISSKGELLGGKMIDFKVNGKAIGSAPTAAAGTSNAGTAKAPFHVSGDYPPGTYKIEAHFAGDATTGGGRGQGTLTVVKAQTKFEMSLDKRQNPPIIGGTAYLEGFLINTANPASKIDDRNVTVRANRNTFIKTITTYGGGKFSFFFPISLDLAALNSLDPKLPFTVEAEFAGDTYFEPTQKKFTFVAGAQPAPRIESAIVVHRKYLQLKGNNFMPAQYENDFGRWMKEFRNWVFIYADDGRGLKPVPLASGKVGDINMREIDLDTSTFNLHSIKFKVVRGRQESNIFQFSYTFPDEVKVITIKSIDPAKTKVGDPQEKSYFINLYMDSFNTVYDQKTKIIFAGEEIPENEKRLSPTSNNEGWVRFYVPTRYRHSPGHYPVQVINIYGVKSNIVYWDLEPVITVNPAMTKSTPKKLK